MAVYVDPLFNTNGWSRRWPFARACHMVADTVEELDAMADRIGLKRSWRQGGTAPHYDLTSNKRREAVRAGAVQLNRRQMSRFIKGLDPFGEVKAAEGTLFEKGSA